MVVSSIFMNVVGPFSFIAYSIAFEINQNKGILTNMGTT